MRATKPRGRLVAVLCNPSLRPAEQTTSWRNVEVLTSILECESFELANLIDHPTRSTVDLSDLAQAVSVDDVERRISNATQLATVVAVGWGARAPAGWRQRDWRNLVTAAARGLSTAGHARVVHVSNVPRHPSRWRQHTSPTHHRYAGSCFEERLAAALHWSDVHEL